LLRLVARDCDVRLRATAHPEFDAWRWHDYWVPLDAVIEFKREVYQQALLELSRFVFKPVRGHVKSARARLTTLDKPSTLTVGGIAAEPPSEAA